MARAVLFTGSREVTLSSVPLPPPGPEQLLVRTEFSGISAGSELLAYRGELDPRQPRDERIGSLGGDFSYPFAYGYSCVGWVERGGAAIPAGALVFAFHPHQDVLVIDERDVVVLAEGTDLRLATLFPLVETALQLALDAGPVFAEPVVVLGLGAVGLLTALLLGRAGATVLGVEPRGWRRELAAGVGVRAVDVDELPAVVRDATGGRGVPLVIDAAGAPAALAGALDLLAHEGVVVVASWYGAKPVTLPLGGAFHRRRLVLRSSQVSTIPQRLAARWDVPRRRAVARDLLGQLPLADLATTELPVEEAAAGYAALDRGVAGVLHVALRYA